MSAYIKQREKRDSINDLCEQKKFYTLCQEVKRLREFVGMCAHDQDDRVSPGVKGMALEILRTISKL
jgi:hypothetical protein